jgi:metal-responsive CopG/Arc/MetJ family transcriptional regulator|tara:strand:+ start:491 stop:628 length:138 start_codon:yes stop_codon:yes gene_type:complete
MKQIFTISIDEELVQKIREYARKSPFRNKSHLAEEAIKEYLKAIK